MTKSSSSQERHWFIAYVKSCHERKVAEALTKAGFVNYLPRQREVHKWSDRRKIVERLVIPRMIFIRCRECDRINAKNVSASILGYMANGPYNPAIVRDPEMESFMAMVERSGRTVEMAMAPPAPGDRVRVKDGPLAGMECELVEVSGQRCLAVRLGALGTAKLDLALDTVEKI